MVRKFSIHNLYISGILVVGQESQVEESLGSGVLIMLQTLLSQGKFTSEVSRNFSLKRTVPFWKRQLVTLDHTESSSGIDCGLSGGWQSRSWHSQDFSVKVTPTSIFCLMPSVMSQQKQIASAVTISIVMSSSYWFTISCFVQWITINIKPMFVWERLACCQLGVSIPLWAIAELPWRKDHLIKQTNKQTSPQANNNNNKNQHL